MHRLMFLEIMVERRCKADETKSKTSEDVAERWKIAWLYQLLDLVSGVSRYF